MNDSAPATPQQMLLDVVREEFGRVAYSHKAHMKMVDRLNGRLLWEKRLNAALLALTAGNTIGVLAWNARWAEVAAVVLSGFALLLTVYGLSRNREHVVDQHRRTGLALWVLRENYIHLIGDLRAGAVTIGDGRSRRDALTDSASRIYASAPDTSSAYRAAQKALKTDEELTFSPGEIDVMLPRALRSDVTPTPPPASAA